MKVYKCHEYKRTYITMITSKIEALFESAYNRAGEDYYASSRALLFSKK